MVIRKQFIFCFVLFFINEVTSSDTPAKGGFEDENTASESAYSEKKADVADSLLYKLQQPAVGADPSWPSAMRLDPMFIEFPDLFTSPGMETDAIDPYMKRRAADLDATFDLGIQYRQAGKLDLSKKTFIRWTSYSNRARFCVSLDGFNTCLISYNKSMLGRREGVARSESLH